MRNSKFILSRTILKSKSVARTPSQVREEYKKDMEKALDSITGKPESQRSGRFLFSRQNQHYHGHKNEEQIPKQVEYQNRLDEGRPIPEQNPTVVFVLVFVVVDSRIGTVAEYYTAMFHDQIGGVVNQRKRESRAHGSPPGQETGSRWSGVVHEKAKPTERERERD